MFLLRKKKANNNKNRSKHTSQIPREEGKKIREDDNKSSDSVFSCDKGKVTAQKTAKAQLRNALKRVFFFLPKGPLRLNKFKQKKGRKKKRQYSPLFLLYPCNSKESAVLVEDDSIATS